jgi:hypothetical protein
LAGERPGVRGAAEVVGGGREAFAFPRNFVLAIEPSIRVRGRFAGMRLREVSQGQRAKANHMKSKTISLLGILITAVGFFIGAAKVQATVVDLTTGPDASGQIGDALFFATQQQPAGTGFIDPFLRIQEKGFEQGYNTDGGFPFDDKHPHNYQHSLLISDLIPVFLNGQPYLQFMLDSNQNGNSFTEHVLEMTALQIFTTNDPNQTTESFNSKGILQLNGTLVYNMNANGNNAVLTTATGSGKADMFMYIPANLVKTGEQYLVLYSAFGNDIPSDGGFEEWVFIPGTVPIPETGMFFPVVGLLAAVLCTRVLQRRRAARQPRQETLLG